MKGISFREKLLEALRIPKLPRRPELFFIEIPSTCPRIKVAGEIFDSKGNIIDFKVASLKDFHDFVYSKFLWIRTLSMRER